MKRDTHGLAGSPSKRVVGATCFFITNSVFPITPLSRILQRCRIRGDRLFKTKRCEESELRPERVIV